MFSKLPKLRPRHCAVAFFASAFQAFGMYNIHALSGVTEGGIFGLILLLNHWLGLSPAFSSLILNGGCYLLGWKTLGKEFIGYSVVATLGYSACYRICEQFPPLWPGIAELPDFFAQLRNALYFIQYALSVLHLKSDILYIRGTAILFPVFARIGANGDRISTICQFFRQHGDHPGRAAIPEKVTDK